jgi:hypothetical protein
MVERAATSIDQDDNEDNGSSADRDRIYASLAASEVR